MVPFPPPPGGSAYPMPPLLYVRNNSALTVDSPGGGVDVFGPKVYPLVRLEDATTRVL